MLSRFVALSVLLTPKASPFQGLLRGALSGPCVNSLLGGSPASEIGLPGLRRRHGDSHLRQRKSSVRLLDRLPGHWRRGRLRLARRLVGVLRRLGPRTKAQPPSAAAPTARAKEACWHRASRMMSARVRMPSRSTSASGSQGKENGTTPRKPRTTRWCVHPAATALQRQFCYL